MSGEAMTYLDFEEDQPNNYASKQDCLDLHGDLFSDNNCVNKLPFVCVWGTYNPVRAAYCFNPVRAA